MTLALPQKATRSTFPFLLPSTLTRYKKTQPPLHSQAHSHPLKVSFFFYFSVRSVVCTEGCESEDQSSPKESLLPSLPPNSFSAPLRWIPPKEPTLSLSTTLLERLPTLLKSFTLLLPPPPRPPLHRPTESLLQAPKRLPTQLSRLKSRLPTLPTRRRCRLKESLSRC